MMPKLTHTDEELALLTPAELAGLSDTEGDGDEEDGAEETGATVETQQATEAETAAADAASKAPAEDVKKTDGDGKEPAADNAETGIVDPVQVAADAAATADEDEDVFDYTPRPVPQIRLPDDAKEQIEGLQKRKTELANKLHEGDIDAAEFDTETATIDAQLDPMKEAVSHAKFAFEQAKAEWFEGTIPAFIKQFPMYRADSVLFPMLDVEVRRLTASGDFASPFDPKILVQAHKKIKADIEAATGTKMPKTAKDAKTEPGKAVQRTLPPTLARLPAASAVDTNEGSRFANLDRLEGEAYQNALAKLSDNDREEYLAR